MVLSDLVTEMVAPAEALETMVLSGLVTYPELWLTTAVRLLPANAALRSMPTEPALPARANVFAATVPEMDPLHGVTEQLPLSNPASMSTP